MASSKEKHKMQKILIIEPFYGGSHKQLVDLLCEKLNVVTYTLPAKKWHWRARTSALYFSQHVVHSDDYQVLFTSSVLNLAELVALRPDIGRLKKVLYFHENQLVYPVRKQQDRDFQYGYNQVLSCLVADKVLFNSAYNQDSFLNNMSTFLKLIPDHRPKGLADQIRPKCQVLYYPLVFSSLECKDGNLKSVKSDNSTSSTSITDSSVTALENSQLVKQRRFDNFDGESSSDEHDVCSRQVVQYSYVKSSMECDCVEQEAGNRTNSDADQTTAEGKVSKKRSEPVKDAICGDDMTRIKCDSTSLIETQCGRETSGAKSSGDSTTSQPLHIVWAHRWEHDKDPDTFFNTLYRLHDDGLEFRVSVMGETFTDVPEIFSEARTKLSDHIITWGYQDNRGDYSVTLQSADVAVSTALHEFYGVAMLEAVYFQCFPLCPDRLVYPEIFPACCLYRTPTQLYKRLREFCRRPHLARSQKPQINLDRFMWETLREKYEKVLCI